MRVTIDAVPLLLRSAGVKNYLYYWVQRLQQQGPGLEISLFPFLRKLTELNHEGSVSGQLGTALRVGTWLVRNRLPAAAGVRLGPRTDVFHASKLLYPPRHAKWTATIHDLTCWLFPETHLAGNVMADRLFAERVFHRADGLIAVSENTRQDAIRILKIAPEKIRVIHSGVAEAFFDSGEAQAKAARLALGLDRPYILFLGTIEPRKNVDTLLNAYAALPGSIREEFDLVLAGSRGWASEATMARLATPPPGVRYLGYVPEGILPGLFTGAAVFVYPSLYEGFGFPVAQAMAAGAPVITSAVSSLPEIAGEAAMLVDPRSQNELRNSLASLLTSPSAQEERRRMGKARAQQFSWTRCARESQRFFEDVAGGSSQ